MSVLTSRLRLLALIVSLAAAMLGSWLLSLKNSLGLSCLAFGLVLCCATQWGVFSRLTDDERFKKLPLGLEIPLLLTAALFGGYTCFSFLNSLAGFHFDIAEHFGVVSLTHTILLRVFDKWPVILSDPHCVLVSVILDKLGWSLLHFRLLGALESFLLLPTVYFLVRGFFNRTTAAFSVLITSGSLWLFTLSKLAHFAVPVPLFATLTIYCVWACLRWRRAIVFPAIFLVLVLIISFNIYVAYRLIFFVVVPMTGFFLLFGTGKRIRVLLIPLIISLAIVFQFLTADPLLFTRVQESSLLRHLTVADIMTSAQNYLGKLFYSGYDIELSPSQGGLDHPLIIGLFLVGLAVTVVNCHTPQGFVLAVWNIVPALVVIWMEGQWRRATVTLPAIYICASLPLAVAAFYLLHSFRCLTRLKAYGAMLLPMLFGAGVIFYNINRFADIQQNRSGGYYIPAEELAVMPLAVELCEEGDFYLFTDGHLPLWNFFSFNDCWDPTCFENLVNTFSPLEGHYYYMMELIDESSSQTARTISIIIDKTDPFLALIARLDELTVQSPPRAVRRIIPGARDQYRWYQLGKLSGL